MDCGFADAWCGRACSWNPDGLLQRAVRALKKEVPQLLVITDVALDPYSSDGHDGYVRAQSIYTPLSSCASAKAHIWRHHLGH